MTLCVQYIAGVVRDDGGDDDDRYMCGCHSSVTMDSVVLLKNHE